MFNTDFLLSRSYAATNWAQSSSGSSSSFQTNPFAHSVFQQTTPANVYPTPPPGITSSSSSLAYALGPPPPQPQPQKIHTADESSAFFDRFLEEKNREMDATTVLPQRPKTPPPKPNLQIPQESPDPIALQSSMSKAIPSTTPRKRKVYVQLESPSVKRVQSTKSFHSDSFGKLSSIATTPSTPVPSTPSTFSTSMSTSTSTSKISMTPSRMTLAYVAVPPKPWLTPSSPLKGSLKQLGKMKIIDTPDLGGYGTEDDDGAYSPIRTNLNDTIKSSARRTGDRDERRTFLFYIDPNFAPLMCSSAPLEKLTSLIEDIFEAEDSLPTDPDHSSLPADFFSPTTTSDFSRPLLQPSLIRKLTKYIGYVARPTKRLRTVAGMQGTPKSKGRMAEVETQVLSRLLKLLERNVRAGEDVDPFSSSNHASPAAARSSKSISPQKKSPKKAARGKKIERRSKSKSPSGDEGEEESEGAGSGDPMEGQELTESDFDRLARVFDVARDSILAAGCCIALLGSDRLTKQVYCMPSHCPYYPNFSLQLYSEELITACLNTIKNQLTKIIYPFVEVSTELSSAAAVPGSSTHTSPLLLYLIRNTTSSAHAHQRQLSDLFQVLSAVLPRINDLINAESVSMSDAIIIQAVYIAIGPFFVVDSGGDGSDSGSGIGKGKKENVVLRTFGKSAMRGLRLDALSLIRSVSWQQFILLLCSLYVCVDLCKP